MAVSSAVARGFELAKLASRPDPMLSFKWMCIDGALPFGHPADYLENCDIPFNNIKSDSVFVGGGYLAYPGAHEIEAVSMSFYEDHNGSTVNWIQGWKNKVKNLSTGNYKLPKDYKRDMRVGLLTTKGEVSVEVTLVGIWPTATANFSLSYNESGRLIVQQTFSVDDNDFKFNRVAAVG